MSNRRFVGSIWAVLVFDENGVFDLVYHTKYRVVAWGYALHLRKADKEKDVRVADLQLYMKSDESAPLWTDRQSFEADMKNRRTRIDAFVSRFDRRFPTKRDEIIYEYKEFTRSLNKFLEDHGIRKIRPTTRL